jgi:hypothetical protein
MVPQELEVARPANGSQDRAHDPPDRDARGGEQGDALLPQQPGGRRRAPRGSSPEPLVSGEHLPLRARRDLRRRRLPGPRAQRGAQPVRAERQSIARSPGEEIHAGQAQASRPRSRVPIFPTINSPSRFSCVSPALEQPHRLMVLTYPVG